MLAGRNERKLLSKFSIVEGYKPKLTLPPGSEKGVRGGMEKEVGGGATSEFGRQSDL